MAERPTTPGLLETSRDLPVSAHRSSDPREQQIGTVTRSLPCVTMLGSRRRPMHRGQGRACRTARNGNRLGRRLGCTRRSSSASLTVLGAPCCHLGALLLVSRALRAAISEMLLRGPARWPHAKPLAALGLLLLTVCFLFTAFIVRPGTSLSSSQSRLPASYLLLLSVKTHREPIH